jgi:hypothetical protein
MQVAVTKKVFIAAKISRGHERRDGTDENFVPRERHRAERSAPL